MSRWAPARRRRLLDAGRVLIRRPSGAVGLGITVALVVVAAAAPVLAPHSPSTQFTDGLTSFGAPVGPSRQFLLGTDALGRDLLSRLIFGLRNTLQVAVAANLIASVIGVAVGGIAGYFGGWLDALMMRLTEVLLAVPAILLAGFLALVTQPSPTSLVLIIAGVNWYYLARIVRGEVIAIRVREFVEAAVVAGAGPWRILVTHVLRQVWSLVFVYMTLQFSTTAIFVASMSFVGIGIQPPTPSLGNLIADGSQYLTSVPRLAIIPGVLLAVAVLGFNLLGDSLRDALAVRD
ncbi:MAG TPA: ABC transporter permease [Verrucomicrobiae bacterium]|nr:ABC transporter permease [Verrucomicrobiae bacterium]